MKELSDVSEMKWSVYRGRTNKTCQSSNEVKETEGELFDILECHGTKQGYHCTTVVTQPMQLTKFVKMQQINYRELEINLLQMFFYLSLALKGLNQANRHFSSKPFFPNSQSPCYLRPTFKPQLRFKIYIFTFQLARVSEKLIISHNLKIFLDLSSASNFSMNQINTFT